MPAANSTTLTVADVAGRYGVTESTVLAWVRSGELRAVNVGRSARARKPRWRITPAAVEAFEAARTAAPVAPASPRRRPRTADVVEFYR